MKRDNNLKIVQIYKKITKINPKVAQGLMGLAKWAEKEHIKGPKDLSENHDKYIWGK